MTSAGCDRKCSNGVWEDYCGDKVEEKNRQIVDRQIDGLGLRQKRQRLSVSLSLSLFICQSSSQLEIQYYPQGEKHIKSCVLDVSRQYHNFRLITILSLQPFSGSALSLSVIVDPIRLAKKSSPFHWPCNIKHTFFFSDHDFLVSRKKICFQQEDTLMINVNVLIHQKYP